MKIEAGQVWLENESGRLIRVVSPMVHDTGPACEYIDKDGNREPVYPALAKRHSHHARWFVFYCDLWDFSVWNRFSLVTHANGKPARKPRKPRGKVLGGIRAIA